MRQQTILHYVRYEYHPDAIWYDQEERVNRRSHPLQLPTVPQMGIIAAMENNETQQDRKVELGVGSWGLVDGYWGQQERKISYRVLELAIHRGIQHFDTAPAYGRGRAEQLLGQRLRAHRESVKLSTKFYPTTPEGVEKALTRSLRRLMTDRIDEYYLHWPNPRCPLPDILKAVTRLKEQGLIGEIGVSNFTRDLLKESLNWAPITLYQGAYSLAWPLAELGMIPLCKNRGVRFVAYSPLGQGVLSCRLGEYPQREYRKGLLLLQEELLEVLQPLRRKISQIAGEQGISEAAVALSSVLWGGEVDGVVMGVRTPKQLEECLVARSEALPEPDRRILKLESRRIRDFLATRFSIDENMWGHPTS